MHDVLSTHKLQCFNGEMMMPFICFFFSRILDKYLNTLHVQLCIHMRWSALKHIQDYEYMYVVICGYMIPSKVLRKRKYLLSSPVYECFYHKLLLFFVSVLNSSLKLSVLLNIYMH